MMALLFLICAWTESFESQDYFPPDNWLIVNEDALDAFWYMSAGEGHSGNHSAACDGDTLYSGLEFSNLDYLITPRVLPLSGSNDTTVSFWCRATHSTGCSLDVMVSTASPPAMNNLIVVQSYSITDTSWNQRVTAIGAYNEVPVYVVFRLRRLACGERLFLDDVELPAATAQHYICNGRLRTKGPPAQKYLQLWGTHYEMGFGHGYLLGEECLANFVRFAVGSSNLHRITPFEYEFFVLPYFRQRFTVPAKYQEEAQGIFDGAAAKGIDRVHPELGREITVEDILCMNALCDFNIFGCSSISAWGESTINDDSLQGGLVIARDLDYSAGQYTSMGNTAVIIACAPSAEEEQDFVLVSVAGSFGCLSGVNQEGVGLCVDYGNHPDTGYIPPNSLVPFIFSMRNAIETEDPDQNGINDIHDIRYSFDHSTSLTSWDVHLFSPADVLHPVPDGVLEANNIGDSLRVAGDNNIAPVINSQYNIAVTNHDRVLYAPVYCYRYEVMAESINDDFRMNTQRAVNIENAVAGWGYFAGTLQSIVMRPNIINDHPDWAFLGLSNAFRNRGAHVNPKHYYSWNELFDGVTQIKEEYRVSAGKKDYHSTIQRAPLKSRPGRKYHVYDAAGRRSDPQHLAPGIYFLVAGDTIKQKVIIVR